MSIHNTKKPLYCIWHINAEDSPLGMMMRNVKEGAHVTVEEWNKIPSEVCQNLIESMSRRLEAVIKAKGGHTKY
jgi:hypothetical protein